MSGLSILCVVLFINIFLRSYFAMQVSSYSYHHITHYLEEQEKEMVNYALFMRIKH